MITPTSSRAPAAAVETEIQADNSDNNFTVNAPITAPLAINGGDSVSGGEILTVNGDNANNFVVGPNEITGAGAPIFYTNVQGVIVSAASGNNTFTLNGDTVPTTLMGGARQRYLHRQRNQRAHLHRRRQRNRYLHAQRQRRAAHRQWRRK